MMERLKWQWRENNDEFLQENNDDDVGDYDTSNFFEEVEYELVFKNRRALSTYYKKLMKTMKICIIYLKLHKKNRRMNYQQKRGQYW